MESFNSQTKGEPQNSSGLNNGEFAEVQKNKESMSRRAFLIGGLATVGASFFQIRLLLERFLDLHLAKWE